MKKRGERNGTRTERALRGGLTQEPNMGMCYAMPAWPCTNAYNGNHQKGEIVILIEGSGAAGAGVEKQLRKL